MPYDAVFYLAIALIVFFYSMVNDYFSAMTAQLFVYLIYAIGALTSVVMGFFLINMYDREEEGESPF
ncbi:MAG: hypothetical protein ACP5GS_07445 [Nitrososphaeria archaeon]